MHRRGLGSSRSLGGRHTVLVLILIHVYTHSRLIPSMMLMNICDSETQIYQDDLCVHTVGKGIMSRDAQQHASPRGCSSQPLLAFILHPPSSLFVQPASSSASP
jgi:hypothetical protein